jgi:hypothetical protein
MNLSARDLWFGRQRSDLCSAVEIPDTHQPVFRVAAPVETFCGDYCSFAWFKTPSATNTLAVGETQTWSPIVFLDSERRRGTDLNDPLSDGGCQLSCDNFGHAAAIAISQQSLDGDQPVRLAQTSLDYFKDHRSHPE